MSDLPTLYRHVGDHNPDDSVAHEGGSGGIGYCWLPVTERKPDMTRPADNSEHTWHVHDNDTWAWGISCPECLPEPRHGTTRWPKSVTERPQLNIKHLRAQNALGMTAREQEREALGDRWDDPKVQRVR